MIEFVGYVLCLVVCGCCRFFVALLPLSAAVKVCVRASVREVPRSVLLGRGASAFKLLGA